MPVIIDFSIVEGKDIFKKLNYKIRHAALLTAVSEINSELGDYLHSNPKMAHYSIGWAGSSILLNVLKDDNWIIRAIKNINNLHCNTPSGAFILEVSQKKKFLYLDLYKNATARRLLPMSFITPTSFRQKGRQIILPDPRLIFNSLLSRWNVFSPVNFSFPEEFYRDILWDKFAFRTTIMDLGRYKIKGFTGNGTIRFWKSIPKEYLKMLNTLYLYSMISGVGYKTTMGFGLVRG
jgi:CRISPR-associated endoribonuclease Cas6